MRMFIRGMALMMLLGVVSSDALAQVTPGPTTPAATARMRRAYKMSHMTPTTTRRQRRHRPHRVVKPPVVTPPVTTPVVPPT